MKKDTNTLQNDNFGYRLRKCREAAGLSQNELAALVGTSQPAISRYESTDRAPSLKMIVALLKALECEASCLINWDDNN